MLKRSEFTYNIFIIFIFHVFLSYPHLSNIHFWAPDADRIGMDGVFILDFIKDLPESLLNIYGYTTEYYAKYPALSIGYRPAFFPLIEAGFYFLFGISHLSARMAVLFFLFFGMIFWFLLVRDIYDPPTAILSLLLWLTNPFVYKYSQQNMLEIPTLCMGIICVYYLYKYEATLLNRYGIILGIVVGLTLLTNQKSGYILILLIIYPISNKNLKLFITKNTWIAVGIILLFLIPLVCITLWLGDKNLSQSIGIHISPGFFTEFHPLKDILNPYPYHFSLAMLILVFVGVMGFSLRIRRKCGDFLRLVIIEPLANLYSKFFVGKSAWITVSIIILCLIPLVFITLGFGDKKLEPSVDIFQSMSQFSNLKPLKNISYIYRYHFPLPILVLALIGVIFVCIGKNAKCLIFFCCILSVYLFFTIILVKIPRYPMYWIPFFCFFAAIGLQKLISYLDNFLIFRKSCIKYAIFSLPILLQVSLLPNVFVGYAAGYEEAASYVSTMTKSPVIFFEGRANGQFIFYARIHDPERRFVILRGSKIITSSSLYYKDKLKIHLNDREEIYKTLSDLSVHFAVVESKDTSGIKIYSELRELFKDTSRFKLHPVIEVKSNISSLQGQNLLIYEKLDYQDNIKDQILNLRLPLVGKTIKLKLKQILR